MMILPTDFVNVKSKIVIQVRDGMFLHLSEWPDIYL
jgi:hypothetical protein